MIVVRPDTAERRTAVFKNSHLRLLMKLTGMRLMGPSSEETPESAWILPEDVSVNQIRDSIHYINQAEFSPPTFEDGGLAENQLKRKAAARKKAAYDDDDDDDGNGFIEGDMLFPAGGPTVRRVADEKKTTKKQSRKRRRRGSKDVGEANDSELEDKARKRREKELEKARKIKSALYVREGDDDFDSDEDAAFFAREREIAARAKQAAASATAVTITSETNLASKRRKLLDDTDSAMDSDGSSGDGHGSGVAGSMLGSQDGPPADEEEDDANDTPPDDVMAIDGVASDGESPGAQRQRQRRPSNASGSSETMQELRSTPDVHETGDADVAVPLKRRPRARGGFVIDSDDED